MAAAPEVLRVDDDDPLEVSEEIPGEELLSQVEMAVRVRPMMALSLVD